MPIFFHLFNVILINSVKVIVINVTLHIDPISKALKSAPKDTFGLRKVLFLATVSNKNTHLADFETCVFRGYLRNHLSYKKVFYIYLHPCLKSFQMKK